jgi:hypothetical protein
MRGRPARLNGQVGSPLPQEEVALPVDSVRVVDAYFQFLPSQQLTFFQRPFFANYPIPLALAGMPPYPRPISLLKLQAPKEACIVLQSSVFKVFEHSGIDPKDIVEVDPSRVTTVFGFQLKIGGRGSLDYMTNLTTKGDPIILQNNPVPTYAPNPGQGTYYPFAGASQVGLQNFATYVRPGQTIEAAAIALRAPPFETKLLSVEINGFLVPEFQLDRILRRMSGGGT